MRKASPDVPDIGEGKRGEQGYLGYLLRQASAAHRLRMERALADKEVTLPQFLTLTMLEAYPGISNADLARLAMLTPQTVSVIIKNLERSGLVRRQPHPIHGRIQRIEASESGRRLLKQCRAKVNKVEQALMKGLGAEEEKVVRRWLVAIADDGQS
ncbi:Putative transcription regulator, MarR [Alloalcanivorax dieselolei B5]|uniref:MarR family transcriptional regulator n=2 Tax=Alloalcanivorax TaxID=3020832 RepID=A0ABT2QZE1_9GAMM|nr:MULTISPECIES: MarR family transcriptional regulator [Alloalcanivorax]AFT69613.1 Putative transcription regulator, MarR [Alloalcanivorax dieselolei B5]MCU5782888.1 MarR family transcriptional regulator [Alloalcanivorax balearicus MACL04]GGK03749.1 transcriptional regulator [Alloalcanivorax dieselolei]